MKLAMEAQKNAMEVGVTDGLRSGRTSTEIGEEEDLRSEFMKLEAGDDGNLAVEVSDHVGEERIQPAVEEGRSE